MMHPARRRIALVLLVLCAGLLAGAGPAAAQSMNFSSTESALPIEVTADNGIEWRQDNKLFLAHGNARASRGDVSVHGDLLRAFYREKPDGGGTEIYRLEAVGSVRIVSPGETAYGDDAVYDVDNGVMVLRGKEVRLVTAEDTITADQQIEYYDTKRMAVARGHAVAQRADRRIRTDVLVAYFKPGPDGKSRVYRVDAFDNVHITTPQDQAWADRGVYNVDSSVATLSGDVKLVRGENTLVGCSAEVNLKTGISKLRSCEGQARGVRGLLKPEEKPAPRNRSQNQNQNQNQNVQ